MRKRLRKKTVKKAQAWIEKRMREDWTGYVMKGFDEVNLEEYVPYGKFYHVSFMEPEKQEDGTLIIDAVAVCEFGPTFEIKGTITL